MIKKLSILIPCYNEKKTILEVINEVKKFKDYPKEIIIVDDGSADGTREILKEIRDPEIEILFQDKNYGKGYAISCGIKKCTGDITIIQDADLEYNPKDYQRLLEPFITAGADVVFGSRFIGSTGYVRLHYYLHYVANKILTHFCNLFTNLNMTDMETGYKAFKTNLVKNLKLKEKSFGIEPELTVKLAKKKCIFYEVGISYRGRSYDEGKKITFKDAFRAFYCIIRYRFLD